MTAETGFVSRLREAIAARDVDHEELAARTNLSVGDIRKWIDGESGPTSDESAALAAALDLDFGWLHDGDGTGPSTDLDAQRVEYRTEARWRFRPLSEDGARDYGNANVFAFDPDLETFMREVGQNVLDVVSGPSATVNFRLIRLQGPMLADFFEALNWTDLREHLQGSAAEGQKFGKLLERGLERVQEEDELVVLRIEEHRTRGLTGSETGRDSNFAALTKDNLNSQKQNAGAGGAFGLGKAVLWRTSSLATVLFNSDLAVPEDGKQEGRLIGRSDLGFHETGAGEFAGPGWFGRGHGHTSQSYWGNRALARDLMLARAPGMPGTSILILGFHDPTAEGDEVDLENLRDRLTAAATANFWPAISDGRLKIRVEVSDGPDTSDETSGGLAEPHTHEPEFDALESARRDQDFVESLAEEGDVARVTVPLTVPKRDGLHDEFTHDAELLVRRAAPYDSENPNRVAFMRGTGMVVEYRPMGHVRVGARPFHAAVRCGTAADESVEARNAEEFLRLAEPPAHNTWTRTPDVALLYARGSGAALKNFINHVRAEIGKLVGPSTSDLSDGPEGLKRLLQVKATREKVSHPDIRRATVERVGDSWKVDAVIRPASDHAWSGEPVVFFAAETGGGVRVKAQEIGDCRNCELSDGRLIIKPTQRKISFTVTTDPTSHPTRSTEVGIGVDLRSLKRLEDD